MELEFENHRWFAYNVTRRDLLLPIPACQFRVSGAKLTQNPGY